MSRTKAKKQAKLKRQMASIRKAGRREEGNNGEARFAAMQLVNDPQAFAEHLFGRLQSGSALKFDTKMLLIQVVSRVVGLHRLHLLHLYPFLQRYVQPNQREVTRLLASAATACHELVPPDALEPLLRQLVNQFVHDRARPEVVAVGINTVREICVRCPLVMHSDLLQDLAQYKRARDKPWPPRRGRSSRSSANSRRACSRRRIAEKVRFIRFGSSRVATPAVSSSFGFVRALSPSPFVLRPSPFAAAAPRGE